MQKQIIITGGAGFIGSHLCERLLKEGHRVLCVDNFSTGRFANIQHLRESERFEVAECNIAKSLTLSNGYRPVELKQVDEIYNLACPASPAAYQRDPVGTLETAFTGTANMCEYAKWWNAKLLQASTSEVYGDPAVHPQREDYWGNVNPVGLRSCYDEGKRAAESLCMNYHRVHGVDVRIVRIFNTYGERMQSDDGRVIPAFIGQALRNEPMTVSGDGSQTRSFCYVDDLVSGLLAVMDSDITEPVNLGNPVETTIRTLAETIIRLTGSSAEIVPAPLPEDDPQRRCPDISLVRRRAAWQPRVSLEKGLRKTIQYFRK